MKRFDAVDHYDTVPLDVRGANEKDVLMDPASGSVYIAKLGRRNSDLEVMTEYTIFLIGRSLGVNVADARVARYGGQLRFLSKYFLDLNKADELVHGMQLFTELLDAAAVSSVAEDPAKEQAMFTVQSVKAAFGAHFDRETEEVLFAGFVEMLTHDALIGVQDRHHENWGVVVNRAGGMPRFAPLFDSARGLFCNQSDEHLKGYWARNLQPLDRFVARSSPLVGFDGLLPFDGRKLVNHAQLIGAIYRGYPQQRQRIEALLHRYDSDRVRVELQTDLEGLCSPLRRSLILTCLRRRQKSVWKAINAELVKSRYTGR